MTHFSIKDFNQDSQKPNLKGLIINQISGFSNWNQKRGKMDKENRPLYIRRAKIPFPPENLI